MTPKILVDKLLTSIGAFSHQTATNERHHASRLRTVREGKNKEVNRVTCMVIVHFT
jgi:hypothetical protein